MIVHETAHANLERHRGELGDAANVARRLVQNQLDYSDGQIEEIQITVFVRRDVRLTGEEA